MQTEDIDMQIDGQIDRQIDKKRGSEEERKREREVYERAGDGREGQISAEKKNGAFNVEKNKVAEKVETLPNSSFMGTTGEREWEIKGER